ncbi:MAG: O-antigen ligase family protein [Edaphobacter sp.]
MTTALYQLSDSTTATDRSGFLLLPSLIGFIFASRICLTVLWFQDEPETASALSVAISLTLFIAAALSTIGSKPSIPTSAFRNPTLRWIAAFLAANLLSLFWTAGPLGPAASYWVAWLADIGTIWFVLRVNPAADQGNAVMKGYIWGACIVAIVAWCLPALPDLRLGDESFFHPNLISMIFVFGILMAFYLAHKEPNWRWPAFWLTLTLIRTISKTCIAAFCVAMIFYLFKDVAMTRATKIKITIAGLIIVGSLTGLLARYADNYTESVDPATLTGRTVIWAVTSDLAIEKPILGHGFYAYRFVVPPFGTFEATHAHNEILQQFFALGALGVVLVVGLYWVIFRQIRRAPPSTLKTFAATVLVFALVHGITDTLPFDLSFLLWLMAMFSILLAAQSAQPLPPAAIADPIDHEFIG